MSKETADFIIIDGSIARIKELTLVEKVVYCKVTGFAKTDDEGVCGASYSDLSYYTGISRSSIQGAVASLIKKGWLVQSKHNYRGRDRDNGLSVVQPMPVHTLYTKPECKQKAKSGIPKCTVGGTIQDSNSVPKCTVGGTEVYGGEQATGSTPSTRGVHPVHMSKETSAPPTPTDGTLPIPSSSSLPSNGKMCDSETNNGNSTVVPVATITDFQEDYAKFCHERYSYDSEGNRILTDCLPTHPTYSRKHKPAKLPFIEAECIELTPAEVTIMLNYEKAYSNASQATTNVFTPPTRFKSIVGLSTPQFQAQALAAVERIGNKCRTRPQTPPTKPVITEVHEACDNGYSANIDFNPDSDTNINPDSDYSDYN